MMRREAFTKQDIRQLQAFALGIGLQFARDTRLAQGLRRVCIHEAGHAVMYVGLQLKGWRIELSAAGARTHFPVVAVRAEANILMSLAGPLAEEWLCGPRGVFYGALDDLWQVMEAREFIDVDGFKALVAQTRQVLRDRKLQVLAFADMLQEDGTLSEGDLLGDGEAGAGRRSAARRGGLT
jgi:hypothetical protein